MNTLARSVLDYIRKNDLIRQNSRVITGISGGIDSVCLFYVLSELKETLGFELCAVHVEHGIRGESSLRDERFVRALCEREGVPLKVYHEKALEYAGEHSLSVEEAARLLRYRDFEDALSEMKADRIALAHHKNDQAETFLFNLIRGSSLKGLTAMAPARDRIIRPLLDCTRREIEEYAEERGLSFVTDETNLDETYSRNRIRRAVIPELEKVGPMTVSHIFRAAETIREADEYIREAADELYTKCVTIKGQGPVYTVDIKIFAGNAHILKSYVIKRIIRELCGKWKDVSSVNIEDVLMLTDKQSGRRVELPYGITALKSGGRIVIGTAERIEGGDGDKEETVWFRVIAYDASMGFSEKNYTKLIDYDKIRFGLCIRTRRQGDRIAVGPGLCGQSLKKFFINEKIPVNERDKVLLVADGSEIVWVIGKRLSEKYKLDGSSRRAVIIKATGGDHNE